MIRLIAGEPIELADDHVAFEVLVQIKRAKPFGLTIDVPTQALEVVARNAPWSREEDHRCLEILIDLDKLHCKSDLGRSREERRGRM